MSEPKCLRLPVRGSRDLSLRIQAGKAATGKDRGYGQGLTYRRFRRERCRQ